MVHPKNLRIEDFTYQLPEEKIAEFPAPERDSSKLLIYKNGKLEEDLYRNIAGHLPENALLIFNNTKVIQARLLFKKPTGGVIEIFALEPHSRYRDITTAMHETGKVWWKCLVGGAAKWKHGQVLQKETGNGLIIQATVVEKNADSFTIEFSWKPAGLAFSEVLQAAGSMPIPPYLKREAETEDTNRYQTVFAKHEGSVAAPTAGLHFTEQIFSSFAGKNIQYDYVTLHVGAATFMPVKSDSMEGHDMHEEFIDVSASLIRKIIAHTSPLICVGTTSLRTVESLYWMGVKCLINPSVSYDDLVIRQWEVYDLLQESKAAPADALNALLTWMQENMPERIIIKTQILIAPGYSSKLVHALVTNFHQPRSTLLLLVAALIGDEWRTVYDYALVHDFRFLSYGDGSLLFLK